MTLNIDFDEERHTIVSDELVDRNSLNLLPLPETQLLPEPQVIASQCFGPLFAECVQRGSRSVYPHCPSGVLVTDCFGDDKHWFLSHAVLVELFIQHGLACLVGFYRCDSCPQA